MSTNVVSALAATPGGISRLRLSPAWSRSDEVSR
jgi:hypothetical protein